MNKFIFFLFLFSAFYGKAQDKTIDSLMRVYSLSKNDSIKISCASEASELCAEKDIPKYVDSILKVINPIKNKSVYILTQEAKAYNNLGFYSSFSTKFLDAIDNYLKAIAILEKNNIVSAEINSQLYNNLAIIYMKFEKFDLAKKYFYKSLTLDKKMGISFQIALDYHNLATLYKKMKRSDESIFYYKQSLALTKKFEEKKFVIITCGNLAEIYFETNQIDSCRKYSTDGFNLYESSKTKLVDKDLYVLLISKMRILVFDKKYKEAESFLKILEPIAKSNLYNYFNFQALLKKLYTESGNFGKAMLAAETYYNLKDSISSEEIKNKGELKLMQTNFEIKESVTKAAEKEKLEAEQVKRRNLLYFTFSGLALFVIVVIFSFLFYKRWRVTLKQKSIIEKQSSKLTEQHHLLEKKNKEITDSILYSKEIQNSFLKLPNNNSVFKNYFVLYNPKDIVSGDFYWSKTINQNLFVVVGDCTGHGVSGAFITMYAIQALENCMPAIKNLNELHQLNDLLKLEFDKHYHSGGLVNIGMDYSIICFNENEQAFYISGSSSTVMIKNKNVLNSQKFDSLNIGGKLPAIYNPITLKLLKEEVDSFYMFTDGVVDQKGGDDLKKFGTKKLKEIIASKDKPNECLELELKSWMKNTEQVDDITFVELIVN